LNAQVNRSLIQDDEPIACRISRVANRLDRRKAAATALGLSLAGRLRSGLGSPSSLWIAGLAGFLTAEWLHRPRIEPRPGHAPPSITARNSQSAPVSNIVLLLKLALELASHFAKANSATSRPNSAR